MMMIIIIVSLCCYLSIFVLFIYLSIYLFLSGTILRTALELTVVPVFFSRVLQFEKKKLCQQK